MANVFLLIVLVTTLLAEVTASCSAPEGAMTYKITFHGDWSPLAFPKQYPKFRKNAQWSPLVGKCHIFLIYVTTSFNNLNMEVIFQLL